jgi:hypothetical protein
MLRRQNSKGLCGLLWRKGIQFVFIMKWGGRQEAGAAFSPRSIAVDASGPEYIMDCASGRVLVNQMK